jgi:DNA polymerase
MVRPTIAKLRAEAAGCRSCELWKRATQTVFGEGPGRARAMLVGEQPGDEEDLSGRPFVGPAGRLLDRVLEEAGLDRAQLYVTNAVKHFKWVAKGKRRLHEKPRLSEIEACRPWIKGEVAALEPELIVCLGATAAQAIISRAFRVTRDRGTFVDSPLGPAFATVHPSSILRARDDETRRRERALFVADLRKVAERLAR